MVQFIGDPTSSKIREGVSTTSRGTPSCGKRKSLSVTVAKVFVAFQSVDHSTPRKRFYMIVISKL